MTSIDDGLAAIDRANRHDPTDHHGDPLAWFQGLRAEHWVHELDVDARNALRLAARAHHLERWMLARASYPAGRAGYLRWRRDQKAAHARRLREILADAGVDPETVDRAATIVEKKGLGSDPEVQTFEDAVCLTFIETQFSTTRAKLDRDHMINVVAKTIAKMSPAARTAAATIALSPEDAAVLAAGVAQAGAGSPAG